MPVIRNLNLEVEKGQNSSTIIVSYQICFGLRDKRLRGKWWEEVNLYADDHQDSFIMNLRRRPIFANHLSDESCEEIQRVEKTVNNSLLNEDDRIGNREDEIYVKVLLGSPNPKSTSAISNIVTNRF